MERTQPRNRKRQTAETAALSTKRLCGAKTKSRVGFCKKEPAPGSDRCRIHGGSSPKGLASPHFKTGRYSKHLPTQLAARYSDALSDPELIGLRDEAALLTGLLNERLEKLYSGESKDLWQMMLDILDECAELFEKGDPSAGSMLTNARNIAREGFGKFAVFEQIEPMIEQRRRIIDTEAKRLKDLDQNITAEKAMGIVTLLIDSVRRNVTDRKQLQAISNDIGAALA